MASRREDIVIGSSPLMLLVARALASTGHKVRVIERAERIGGAWQSVELDDGRNVEIACHLIEVFPRVYDLLERVSQAPFVELDAQPIRLHPSGLRVRYFSRLLLLASGGRLFAGYLVNRFWQFTGRLEDQNLLLNYQTKLVSFLRYQLRALFIRPVMRGPRDGFVDFIDRLVSACKTEGVVFEQADVTRLSCETGQLGWVVETAEGSRLNAARVHCTTSANLHCTNPGEYVASDVRTAKRAAVVVDVPDSDLVTPQSYVALWKDRLVSRISRIDEPRAVEGAPRRGYMRFLLEFYRRPEGRQAEIDAILRDKLSAAGIIKPEGSFRFVGQVTCEFTKNVDQLPQGEIEPGLYGYFSTGNLAAGIAAWMHRPPFPIDPQRTENDERMT